MVSELAITPKPKQLKSIYLNGNCIHFRGKKNLPWRPRPGWTKCRAVSLWSPQCSNKTPSASSLFERGATYACSNMDVWLEKPCDSTASSSHTPACIDAAHFCHAAHINKPQFSRRIKDKGWESPVSWFYHAWVGWSVAKPFPAKLRDSSPDAKAARRCIRVQHDTATH